MASKPAQTFRDVAIASEHSASYGRNQVAIVYRQISELTTNPANPRVHKKEQVRQIARSIEAFGFNVPILIAKDGKVICGHGRLAACKQLGWNEVPTVCLEHLSEAQIKAFALADNRLTDTSVWDDRLLAEQLRELSTVDLEFNIEATGFTVSEIDLRIEGLSEVARPPDTADQIPAPGPAVSREGDIWILDRHRIMCGNSLDPANVGLLMGGQRAKAVFTDPPFNVPIEGHVSGTARHREFQMAAGEMTAAQFTTFLTQCFKLLAAHTVDGSLHYVCMDWRHLPEVMKAGNDVYTEFKNLCVWTKNNAGMGSLYRSQHELILVFKNGKSAHRNNVQLGRHGRYRTNVWAYPGFNSLARSSDEGNLAALHPTVKPAALVADAILDCTKRGDIVLDLFLGSGTTVIGAERTGRRCFGIEIDPLHVDTVIRRWQSFAGDEARHAVTGKFFHQMEMETTNA